MVNITDLPTAVYLNEPVISSTIQMLDGGDVEHIIEEYSSSDETTTGGSLDIYKVLEFYREKTSGDMVKTVKKIQQTPIGNFAMYHGLLEDDDSLIDLIGVDRPFRASLNDKGFVRATGEVRRSPFGTFLEFSEDHWQYLDVDVSRDEPAYQQVKGAAEYFEMPIKNLDGSFIFTLNDEYFLDVEPDFPDEYREYTVLGEIRHVYGHEDRMHHMDMMNLNVEKGMDRQERENLRRRRKGIENGLKKFGEAFGRSWSADDYHVSFPDIEIEPMVIYR